MRYINQWAARMPDRRAVLSVYSVLVCLLYSWTLFASFSALPSWIYFLDLFDIAALYAYSLVLDFVDSVFGLIIVLVLESVCTLIPGIRREDFRPRAVMYILMLLTSSVIRLYNLKGYEGITKFLNGESIWWICTFVLTMLLAAIAPRISWLRTLLEGFADRAVVFLYIYLPLSLISLVIVIIRNVF
jgi:hypothetical protein